MKVHVIIILILVFINHIVQCQLLNNINDAYYTVHTVQRISSNHIIEESLVITFSIEFNTFLNINTIDNDNYLDNNSNTIEYNNVTLNGFTQLICDPYVFDSQPTLHDNYLHNIIENTTDGTHWFTILALSPNQTNRWWDVDSPHHFSHCQLLFLNDLSRKLVLQDERTNEELIGIVDFEYRMTELPTAVSVELSKASHRIVEDENHELDISFIELQSHVAKGFKESNQPLPNSERIKFEDKTLTKNEKQNVHDVIELIQLSQRMRHMTREQSQSRMVYELVIRPLINIMRRLATQALEKFLAVTQVNLLLNLLSTLVTLFSTAYITEDEVDIESPDHLPNPIEDFEPVLNHFGCDSEGGRFHSPKDNMRDGHELSDCNQVYNSGMDEPFDQELTLLQIYLKQRHQQRQRTHELTLDKGKTKGKGKEKGKVKDENKEKENLNTANHAKHIIRDIARFREVMKTHAETTDLEKEHALSEAQFLARVMQRVTARNKMEARQRSQLEAKVHLRGKLRQMGLQAAKIRAYAKVNAGAETLERFEQKMRTVVANQHRLNFLTKPVLDLVEPRIFDETTESVTMECQLQLEKTLTIDSLNEIKEFVNTTVVRDVTRRVVTKLTEDLSHNVIQTTSEILTKDLTEIVTKYVTSMMITELTYALTVPIAKALTRAPLIDYYCYFCFHHNLYCRDCQSGMLGEYYLDYYSHYFARYYGRYYSYYYGTYYSKLFSNDMRKPWFWGGQKERPRQVNQVLDPENDAVPVGSHDNMQAPRSPLISEAPGFVGQHRA